MWLLSVWPAGFPGAKNYEEFWETLKAGALKYSGNSPGSVGIGKPIGGIRKLKK